MHSIRSRITILTLCAVIVSVAIVACIGVISIRNLGVRDAEQMLYLLCRTGQMNLDANLDDVEQSVRTVAVMVQDGLDTVSEEDLPNLLEKTRKIFGKEVFHTNDVLTYYFRVDPEVSDTLRGFWYTNLLGDGFTEHEVTDLATYDPNDPEGLVWFTVPKTLGRATWLPPYVTANLDHRVISYNVPVYWNGRFFGVIGMEVASTLMEEEVDHIQLFENGYAYITDEEGKLIYHPYIDTDSANAPKAPESLRSDAENVSNAQESLNSDSANVLKTPTELRGDTANVRYWFNGVEKMAVWLPLRNGMQLYVTVPVEECSRGTRQLIWISVVASVLVLLAVSIISMRYAGHLTKPLRELTAAAEQVEQGNYDFTLQYDKQDEVGILTRAFRRLAE